MDLFILTSGVTDLSAAAVTSATDMTPLAGPDGFPQLVLGTTEPMTLKFLTAASTYESWTAAADYTMYASLGRVTARGVDILAEATIPTAITNGKSGNLPINTDALASYIAGEFLANQRANTVQLTLQISVTDSSGNRRAFAMLPVTVWGRVASFDPSVASIPSVDCVTRSEVLSSLSAAQVAAAAAIASEQAAELAETNAETAEANAEAAQAAAEGAQSAVAANAAAADLSAQQAAASEALAYSSHLAAANYAAQSEASKDELLAASENYLYVLQETATALVVQLGSSLNPVESETPFPNVTFTLPE